MGNLHRILWIDAELRAERYPNARGIAERFEISRRQAARDIEYMRYSLGAPVEFCPSRNGYRYEDGCFALPALYLSETTDSRDREAEAARIVGTLLSRSGLPHALRQAVPAGVRPNAAETRGRLQRAIEDRRVVVLRARDPGGALRIRRVRPYRFQLARANSAAYLIGSCEREGRVLAFHMSFIDEVTPTDAHFQDVPPEANRPLTFTAPYTAGIAIARRALPEPLDAQAHWLGDDHCELPFQSGDALLGALLSAPAAFRILSPVWLAERLRVRLRRILAENGG